MKIYKYLERHGEKENLSKYQRLSLNRQLKKEGLLEEGEHIQQPFKNDRCVTIEDVQNILHVYENLKMAIEALEERRMLIRVIRRMEEYESL